MNSRNTLPIIMACKTALAYHPDFDFDPSAFNDLMTGRVAKLVWFIIQRMN